MGNLVREGFRLSPQQKYLWALHELTSTQPYRAVGLLLIDGSVKRDALKHSLAEVVGKHEILRTTFERPPGIKSPFQVVSEDPQFSWSEADLSDLDSAHQQTRLDECFDAQRKQRFNFGEGPLLRACLLKLGDSRNALIVTVPALCADELTLWNLIDEMSQSYESRLKQESLSIQPIQYADFAEWQNELLEAEDKVATQGHSYWKEQQEVLSNSALVLPWENRSPMPATFEPRSVRFTIGKNLVEKIESIAKKYQTSTSVVLLACWEALLWRLTGQSDLVVWTLNDGRKIEDLKTAMGLYAKYLPVFCEGGDRTFSEYLKQAKLAIAQTEEWQEYFDPLAEGNHALANTAANIAAFAFRARPTKPDLAGTVFSVIKRFVCIHPFKIKLSFLSEEESLGSEVEYNGEVLDRETVERIAGYFQKLLARVVQEPEVEIGTVQILETHERRQLFEINQTAANYPEARCIHELFEEQVSRTPDLPAVAYENRLLTYHELNKRANQVAHFLQKRGVGPDSQVALCMKRSAETIVALLGILKAGGAYVPLNADHPKARLEIQLAQSQATVCLTNGDIGPFENSDVIDLDRDLPLLNAEACTNPVTVTTPLNLVYVIYTSGSTGLPKGVAVRHQSLVNYSYYILNKLATDAPLNFATVSTISADLGNTCIFPSLISGGCLHILSNDTAMEATLFAQYISEHSIDVLKIVPSHLNALIASQDGNLLPAKHLFLGGEALSWDLVRRLSQLEHTCRITNHYGPTETTVGSLTYDIDENDVPSYSLTVPIGQPIANTRVYVLDQHLMPVPRGVIGELFIGGTGVADGYWNQPAETAARFIPDSFSSNPDARLYQTGDLVKQLPDGSIEFIGRSDHQVKVRGYRVELAEVEAALEEHDEVRQGVVVARAEPGRDQLVAYMTVYGATPPSQDEIRRMLAQKLPNYMVPSAFVFLKSFPLTPNGKLDRAMLPAPDENRPELQRSFVAPRTATEKEIAAIWSSVLKLSEVGINDDFFELGGHSLLATQVIARARKVFKLDLPLRSLFESPTIAEFADRIDSETEAEMSKLLTALEALSEEDAERLLEMEKTRRDIEGP